MFFAVRLGLNVSRRQPTGAAKPQRPSRRHKAFIRQDRLTARQQMLAIGKGFLFWGAETFTPT